MTLPQAYVPMPRRPAAPKLGRATAVLVLASRPLDCTNATGDWRRIMDGMRFTRVMTPSNALR
jgi:hypothetical protein